ncbi:MAG: DUF2085 domain-containing protein [Chloroflexi bacterium]|nr:DUF2085 domain-containing protein [Chloroflexota bacterium]
MPTGAALSYYFAWQCCCSWASTPLPRRRISTTAFCWMGRIGPVMRCAIASRITSFTIAGRQFPLCARCTGMYLGVFMVFGLLWLNGRLRRGGLPTFPILLLLVGFVALMGIDGVNSYLHFFPNAPHLYPPRNWLRLLTGMGTGLMMGLIMTPALMQTLWRNVDYTPVITSFRELGGMILVALLLIGLLLSNQPVLSYVLALASTAGIAADRGGVERGIPADFIQAGWQGRQLARNGRSPQHWSGIGRVGTGGHWHRSF